MFEDLVFSPDFKDDSSSDFMPLFSIDESDKNFEDGDLPSILPLLALKNTVLFPGVVIPITVGREKSVKAIQKAYKDNRLIGVLSQKDSKEEDPSEDDLYRIGTVARILKLIKMPDDTTTAILQGRTRFELEHLESETPYLEGKVIELPEKETNNSKEFKAFLASIKEAAEEIIQLSPNIPNEATTMLRNINDSSFFLNFIASNLGIKVGAKQSILGIDSLDEKAEVILEHIDHERQILQLKSKIDSKVRVDIDKQQRDYFLNQQLKTIQEELGQDSHHELTELEKRAKKKKWSKSVKEAFDKEAKKARRINPAMAEYGITLNYLELLTELPWGEYTKDNFNLKKANQILDRDHHGLDKVKERILEHLAVLKLKGDMKSPILCLVGPPGVGKTSLGKSVAEALKRKYVRMSLGGLHDESEIRGHRKTYIGAMPGRIIQSLKKVQSSNPVFILDEIDKIGKSFRGDPSSALLEVLDPEQNSTFHDNYLELEYDLSKVLFIATANSLSSIQPALLDRMEIIHVSGYSIEEKVEIAKQHLVPKQRKNHGLTAKDVKLRPEVIKKIVQDYTRESGVRSLDRQMAAVMRSVAKRVAMEESYNVSIKREDLQDVLGTPIFSNDIYQEKQPPGVAVGLAWTSVGGQILFIEVSLSKGKGILTLTGNLGDVMKESAKTALSFIKANAESIGVDAKEISETDIHVHVPEGATPKDGPSAGITMLSALTSAFKKKPLKPFMAMTGEITLRGKVLPVGGIKEKILAAKRAGINEIILCEKNKKHIDDIEEVYIEGMTFHFVDRMSDVLEKAF
ncbi:MAG: ATP-dependent Lon protease [Saprospiraceae bacterium]|jgi:ATP-dependent Lon protease